MTRPAWRKPTVAQLKIAADAAERRAVALLEACMWQRRMYPEDVAKVLGRRTVWVRNRLALVRPLKFRDFVDLMTAVGEVVKVSATPIPSKR